MFHLLLAIIYLSFISLGLPDSLLGSAWPSMYQGLSVPLSYAGYLSMIITCCTVVSSLFSDRMVRAMGTGPVTFISVAMTAAALFGFSASDSFSGLCLWAVPYGLGAGSVDAALNNFIAVHFEAKHMSWLHCFWGIGATLGPYIMGRSLAGHFGWNQGYRVISILQIILTVLLLLSLPLWKTASERTTEDGAVPVSLKAGQILSLPGTRPVFAAFFCYCSLEQVTGLWGSSYLVLEKGIPAGDAASLVSLFFLGITGGRLLSGFLTLRLSTGNLIRLGQGTALAGILLLVFSHSQLFLCAGLLFIGFGCAPIYPCLLHQTPERFGVQASQSMMGFQMASAYLGSMVSPPLAGLLTEKISPAVWPVFQLLFLFVMIFMLESSRMEHETK